MQNSYRFRCLSNWKKHCKVSLNTQSYQNPTKSKQNFFRHAIHAESLTEPNQKTWQLLRIVQKQFCCIQKRNHRERPIRSHTCNMQNPCQTFQKPVWITSKSMRTILLNTTRLNQKFDKLVTETYQKPHPQGAESMQKLLQPQMLARQSDRSAPERPQRHSRDTQNDSHWIRNHFWSQISLVMYIYIFMYLLVN